MVDKQGKLLQIGLVMVVVAMAVVGFIEYRAMSGPSYPKVATAKELHSTEDELALKSGGDFSKLSPDDQKTLDNLTRGHGQKYIQINYARLSSSGGK